MWRYKFGSQLEKISFHSEGRIVLGHRISENGIEVDHAKIETIENLSPLTNVRSFLGHVEFYQWFIRNFSKIAKSLCNLLIKGAPFNFSNDCLQAFELLKGKLITALIIVAPDWSLPFEVMYDASNYILGVVLGQRRNKICQVVYYASKTINEAQQNYTTMEKELLVVVFTFDKFCFYLIGSKIVVLTDHSALKYLLAKKEAKQM